MKPFSRKSIFVAGFAILMFACISIVSNGQEKKPKEWVVPDAAKKVKNPVQVDEESLALGKSLYTKHCKSCHGTLGKGDGPKSRELDTPCGDFTTTKFKAQSAAEVFYKTKEGRDDMPSFKKKISEDEDIWSIVNYVKTLGDK